MAIIIHDGIGFMVLQPLQKQPCMYAIPFLENYCSSFND